MPFTMTADEIPKMLADPAFQALPHTRRTELSERAIAEAGQQVAQDWDQPTFQKWGKFTEKVRGTVAGMEGVGEKIGGAVSSTVSGVGHLVKGLAQDAGTVALAAGEVMHPSGWEQGLPTAKALGKGFAAGVDSMKASAKSALTTNEQADLDVKAGLETLKGEIDQGKVPMDDPAQFESWLTKHDTDLTGKRAKFFADADTILTRGLKVRDPNISETASAGANGLLHPDNAALLSSYMVTRSPETWKQLQQNLYQTPEMRNARKQGDDIREGPAGQAFIKAFGKDSEQHLTSATHPLMLAGFALPLLRGAKAATLASEATGLGAAAKAVGGQMLHTMPEMAAFGAAGQIEHDPQSSAGEIGTAAVQMAATGALLTGGIGAGGMAARGLKDLATRPQDQRGPAPEPTAPRAADADPMEASFRRAMGQQAAPAQAPAAGAAPQGQGSQAGQAAPTPAAANQANAGGGAKPGSSASSPPGNTQTPSAPGAVPSAAGSTPAVGTLVTYFDEVTRDLPPEAPLRAHATGLLADVQAGHITPDVAAERLQLAEVLQPPLVETPELPTTTAIPDTSLYPAREVRLDEIHLSKDVPNFKEGSNASTGVVEGEQLSGRYDRLGTAPIVLWERMDGRKEVITGRHRLDLAKRGGELSIPAQIVREADGFTKADAFTFDAESNIKDGQGSVGDYAHYFKNAAVTVEEATSRGLLARDKGRKGYALGKAASDDLYALYRGGKIGEQTAAAVALEAPGDAGAQSVGIRAALSGASGPDAVNAMKAARSGRASTATQGDFFTDTSLDDQWRAQGKRATAAQKELRDQIAAVSGAAKRPETAAKLGVDVRDPEGINRKLAELRETLTRWENWPAHPDLVEAVTGRKAPVMEAAPAPVDMGADMFGGMGESTRPMNRGETATPQAADLLAELGGATRAGEAERAQGKLDEELFRKQAYQQSAFERAQRGDETAFDDMEAAFRERYPQRETAPTDELSRQVFTQASFASLFETAFAVKDFDTILEAMKMSDKAVYVPLMKRFMIEQADNPTSAVKMDWMRHVFSGTRPMDAAAAAPQGQSGQGSRGQGAAPPPRTASTPPPPRTTAPPPRSASTPPPKKPAPPPPPARIPVNPITGRLAKSPFKIIEDFAKSIGKAMQVRGLKPSQLGVYRPGSTMTAIKFAGDLDTAAHELAGHWTDDKHGLGKPWMKSPTSPYDAELAGFWIHGSPSKDIKIQRAEGIAEFVRAYVMDPAATIKQAPKFAAYFERTIPKDYLAALNAFSDDVRTWAGEQPLRRASLNVRMEPPTLRERLHSTVFGDSREFNKTGVDKMRAWFDDQYHYAVKGFETALKMQGKTLRDLKPSENFDMMLRYLSSHEARLSDQLDNGLIPLKPTQIEIDPTTGKPFPPGTVVKVNPRLEVQRTVDPVTGRPMNLGWLLEPLDATSKVLQETDMREASAMMVAQRTLEKAHLIDKAAADQISALNAASPNYARQRISIVAEAEKAKRHLSGLGAGMMTDVQAANAALADLARDPARARRLQEGARRYRLWADANLDYLVDAGRLSAEQVKTIRAENTHYVDMHRLSEEFDLSSREARGVAGGTLGTAKDVVKRFKGSTLEIENVYKSLLAQTDTIQKEAIRNRVMQTFTNQLESARHLYEGEAVELDLIGSKATSTDRNTVQVYKDGKAEFWKLDKDIHEAVKGMGDLGSHVLIDILSAPQSLARYLITHSPPFAIRNVLRDTVGRSVVSESGARPWDVLQGYTEADKSRLNAFGGGMFGNYAKDRLTWNRELKRGMAELRKDPRNILMTPLQLKHGWEKIMQASETTGRVAEFRRAYDKGIKELGYTPDEAALFAASEARGLIDFAKMGSVMRTINRIVPFSNAHLRGMGKSLSTGMKNPAGFILRWTVFVALPVVLMRLWNMGHPEDEKEYQQLPAWQRDFFWNFKVGNHWVRIPKPHELGVLAGGVERAMSRAMGEKNAFEGYGGSLASALLPMGSPVEATGPLKVPLEIIFNRSTFTNRDIIPSWERDLDLALRKGTEHASGIGKGLGKIMGADPRYIDHFINSYGGIGQAFTDFTTPERRLGENALKQTGLVLSPVSTQSKDYQWVMDWARRSGKTGSHDVKDLQKMIEPVFQAPDAATADRAARALRERATALRTKIQTGGP